MDKGFIQHPEILFQFIGCFIILIACVFAFCLVMEVLDRFTKWNARRKIFRNAELEERAAGKR